VLEEFSLRGGRPLETLARLPGEPAQVSVPSAAHDGTVWFSVSTGPRDRNDTAGGDPAPNSCSGRIVRFDPDSRESSTVLSFPSSVLVNNVFPSPNGRVLAMLAGDCSTSYFNEHVLLKDPSSGRRWTIGADAAVCHALSGVAWSRDGSQLVFAYGPPATSGAAGEPRDDLGAGLCTTPLAGEIAVVPADRTSQITQAELTAPSRGCSYESAAFDRRGIVAIEACNHGGPPGLDNYLGDAYLVQLNTSRHVVLRLTLKVSADGGTVASDPRTGLVLVTEDQGQDAPRYVPHAHDWVWTFNGHQLRLVDRYPQGLVTAEPW
jgi:hypothetical protein